MRLNVVAFARVREVLGTGSCTLDLADGSTAADLWRQLVSSNPALDALTPSTRIACNGRILGPGDVLAEGEVVLLPPVGGG